MSQPYPDRSKLDRGEEVVVTLVATGGDGSEVFELVEEGFDEVAVAVKEGLKAGTRLRFGIGLTQAQAPSGQSRAHGTALPGTAGIPAN